MKHKGFTANGGLSLAVHPTNYNIVLVSGLRDHQNLSDPQADGIYRTEDGEETWTLVKPTAYYKLGDKKGGGNFAFSDNDIVYTGTHEDGLLKSYDNGATWQPIINDPLNNLFKDIKILIENMEGQ